jgi:hypothetical protein
VQALSSRHEAAMGAYRRQLQQVLQDAALNEKELGARPRAPQRPLSDAMGAGAGILRASVHSIRREVLSMATPDPSPLLPSRRPPPPTPSAHSVLPTTPEPRGSEQTPLTPLSPLSPLAHGTPL